MSYFASAVVGVLLDPLIWLAALILAAFALQCVGSARMKRLAVGLSGLAVALVALLSWTALPYAVIAQFESPYRLPAAVGSYAGVIVLGGVFSSKPDSRVRLPGLGRSSERATEPLPSLLENPQLKLLFTGGNARLGELGAPESDAALRFFSQVGVAPERIILELGSRNTYENAINSVPLVGEDFKRPWLLVTSAWHMPRAERTFAKAGWRVTPYAVDFAAPEHIDWFELSLQDGIDAWRVVLRESAGSLVYRLLGRV